MLAKKTQGSILHRSPTTLRYAMNKEKNEEGKRAESTYHME